MDPAVLGALSGFFGALVTLGIPIGAFALRLDRQTRRVERLLTGHEDVEDDGVLPRLREVEGDVQTVETALAEADGIEYERTAADVATTTR
jgi:hypothetical protein